MFFRESNNIGRKIERADNKKKELLPEAFVSAMKPALREETWDLKTRGRSLEQIIESILPQLGEELRKLPEDKPVKVLDFGSGKGVAIEDLKNKYPNWEIHGIDILPSKECWMKTVVKGEASFLPYKSNTFDFVYSSFSYPYFPDKIRAILEALRVTKPSGVILVQGLPGGPGRAYEKTEAPGGKKKKIEKEINILKELQVKGIKATGSPYYRHYSKATGRCEESEAFIRIQKSQGDDERAKLPFKLVGTSPLNGDEFIDSYYKREPQ